MKDLIIIGAGGVGGFLAYNHEHLTNEYRLIGFLDDNENIVGQQKFGYKILGTTAQSAKYSDCAFLLGIAFPIVKEQIITRLAHLNLDYINYISPYAYISSGVNIGKGVIVYPQTFINHHCQIVNFATINSCCTVGHDCKLSDFVTLAPNTSLAGYTQCLEASDIGIGATTKQNIIIGQKAIVGGQAMVINDVPDYAVVAGVPAKILKYNNNEQ